MRKLLGVTRTTLCLLALAIPHLARAQATQAGLSSASERVFHIGASLNGFFGERSWLTPAARVSFQVSPRVGIDVDAGSAILSGDEPVRAPRGFTMAFQLRIGSPHDAGGNSKYLVIGSRTIQTSFPDDEVSKDTFASPYLAFGMDRHLDNGLRAAGEIGVGFGYEGTILIFGFTVQWGPR